MPGLPPMTAIQAATINLARTFHKDKDYGSVEPGRSRSLDRRGRPPQGHLGHQNVKLVVVNGQGREHEFTAM